MEDMLMRFWIGLLLGLLMGVTAAAAYLDFVDTDAGEISSQVDDP
jgi:hypothetical protein